jgi:hypothetical protein
MRTRELRFALPLACILVPSLHASPTPTPHRVTILYDAFGGRAGLTRDWGFAALVGTIERAALAAGRARAIRTGAGGAGGQCSR